MEPISQDTLAPRLQALLPDLKTQAPGAMERLDGLLRGRVRREVAAFLGADHAHVEDVVQESLLASMRYVQRDVEFEGDLLPLVLTIARNRCRDVLRLQLRRPGEDVDLLHDSLPDPRETALDRLAAAQDRDLLQRALDALGPDCRALLRDLFLRGEPTETVRRRLGLDSVQAVYHRKAVCVKNLRQLFQDLAGERSPSGGQDRDTGGGGETS